MSDFAIEAEGLCRDFDGLRAVDHLHLEVPKGIIFGFLGPNGAGKTTTICLLLGLIKPTAGSARVLGFDVRREADRVRERVGALLEHHGLYERLTARDNLDYFGEIYLLPTEERGARIEELLRHLGLWERRNEQVWRFSKGMKQKLAMARARCTDRPWSSWTSPQRGWTRRALRPCGRTSRAWPAGRGTTVFLTTHNLAEAERVCDLVRVINQGKLVARGSPEELRGRAAPAWRQGAATSHRRPLPSSRPCRWWKESNRGRAGWSLISRMPAKAPLWSVSWCRRGRRSRG